MTEASNDKQSSTSSDIRKIYPHRPPHQFSLKGTFMVTAGTLHREHFFNTRDKLQLLQTILLSETEKFGWALKAWAVFANHYHFVAESPDDPRTLPELIKRVHQYSAMNINRMDGKEGRRVWYQYWETKISFHTSYFARLKYVINNPVKHGLVDHPEQYPWCSAKWFADTAEKQFKKKVYGFAADRVNVMDDF